MNGLDFMPGQVYQIIQFGHLFFKLSRLGSLWIPDWSKGTAVR